MQQEHQRKDVSFSLHHFPGYIVSIFLGAGEASLTPLAELVSAGFLCSEVTVCPFVVKVSCRELL